MGVSERVEAIGNKRSAALPPGLAYNGVLRRKCACGRSSSMNQDCEECQGANLAGSPTLQRLPATGQTRTNAQAESLGHNFANIPLHSGSLLISRPGDPEEREADQISENVMRMAQPSGPRQRSQGEISRSATGRGPGGNGLSEAELDFFNPRFGFDFSGVQVHADGDAARSARAVNALAYTVGRDIVFAENQYAPATTGGRRLLAHELAHVVQQSRHGATSAGVQIHRAAASCPSDWATTVQGDHDHAMDMIAVARRKLSAYDGTNPPEVATALATHFHASSATFAGWVNLNLGILRLLAHLASYDCEDTSSWWCSDGNDAKTFWCVPFVDIRVCQPLYFSYAQDDRSRILIHEWVHKYGCNFDLGYAWEPGYKNSWTITALMNADPFARLVQAVQ